MNRWLCDEGGLHPRLAICFALVPIVIGVLSTALVALAVWGLPRFSIFSSSGPLLTGGSALVSWACMAVTVLAVPVLAYVVPRLVWWPTAVWTPPKKRAVLVTSVVYLLVVGSLGVGELMLMPSTLGMLTVMLALVGAGIAHLALARTCAGPRRRDAGAVPCHACDYDLRGQRDCRCPECGSVYTLEELVRE